MSRTSCYRCLCCLLVLCFIPSIGLMAAQSPVTLCVDPDWFPFEQINERGQHEGIAADLVQMVAARAGLQFALVKTKSWDESLEASRQGRCQVLSFLNETPQRRQWLIFTEPLFSDPNVFITREEHPYIADLAYYADETIVLPAGTSIEERIRQNYPGLRILIVETENEAFKMVLEKKADMTLRSLVMAAYTIKKDGLFNLKIAGQLPNYSNHLRMGIANNDTDLQERLNVGIRSITPQERWQSVNKHISINVQTSTDYSLVIKILILFGFLGISGFYWNYQLKKHNQELLLVSQTDALTGIPNRTRLNQVFLKEFERAKRYQSPFAIILLDIDDFKKINDELGHLMGDKVLIEISQISQQAVRATDTLGRWGGEEFLAICPETSLHGAQNLAERICQSVRLYSFSSQRQHTFSAGVAILEKEETVDALIHKADNALAAAKTTGKNKVCAAT